MSLGSQNKALVLLITETSAQLLLWQQRKLSDLQTFRNDPDDQDQFVETIRKYREYPVIIIADLIDENFRHDTIVHVGGKDREALLKRKLDFAFRNTRYRIGIVTGRNPDGRKDDRILLSAINKPDRIDIWAKLLLQEKMAVQAVTSIAHLLTSFLPLEKLDQEEHLLITKLDRDNNLRQTFVKNGKVMFSRLASLNAVPEDRLGVEIHQESTQLRQYLERIQFISYEIPLRIRVLASYPEEILNIEAFSTELNKFEVMDVTQHSTDISVELQDNNLLPSHYLIARVLSKKSIENLYAPASVTRYSDLKKFAKLLLVSAAATLVIGIGINMPGALSVLEKWNQTETFRSRIGPLRQEYATLTQSFPQTPIPPREMELIVRTFDTIHSQIYSPVDDLNLIAAALAISPRLQLNNIEWELERRTFIPAIDEYGTSEPSPTPIEGAASTHAVTGFLLQQRSQIKATINGQAYSPDSFRDAQDQVLAFVKTLSDNPGVKVFASKMPINVRTDTDISTTINDSEVRASFTLELTIIKDTQQGTGQLARAEGQ